MWRARRSAPTAKRKTKLPGRAAISSTCNALHQDKHHRRLNFLPHHPPPPPPPPPPPEPPLPPPPPDPGAEEADEIALVRELPKEAAKPAPLKLFQELPE